MQLAGKTGQGGGKGKNDADTLRGVSSLELHKFAAGTANRVEQTVRRSIGDMVQRTL